MPPPAGRRQSSPHPRRRHRWRLLPPPRPHGEGRGGPAAGRTSPSTLLSLPATSTGWWPVSFSRSHAPSSSASPPRLKDDDGAVSGGTTIGSRRPRARWLSPRRAARRRGEHGPLGSAGCRARGQRGGGTGRGHDTGGGGDVGDPEERGPATQDCASGFVNIDMLILRGGHIHGILDSAQYMGVELSFLGLIFHFFFRRGLRSKLQVLQSKRAVVAPCSQIIQILRRAAYHCIKEEKKIQLQGLTPPWIRVVGGIRPKPEVFVNQKIKGPDPRQTKDSYSSRPQPYRFQCPRPARCLAPPTSHKLASSLKAWTAA